MMDAVSFLKAKDEMCTSYDHCRICPLGLMKNGRNKTCEAMMSVHPDEAVHIVNMWAEDHPDILAIHYLMDDGSYTENVRKAKNFVEQDYGEYWEVKR